MTGLRCLRTGTGNDVTFTEQIGNGWSGMSRLAAGDFTGDGKDDVVAINGFTGSLLQYTSTGTAPAPACSPAV
ncbi:hypothetical protein [Streptomyces sp. NPDC127066]|uniref:hypothetical protein n=1 Tax=Streptomyces sp. NPDC127066 TaxID=3347125 RepID=UPI003650E54A